MDNAWVAKYAIDVSYCQYEKRKPDSACVRPWACLTLKRHRNDPRDAFLGTTPYAAKKYVAKYDTFVGIRNRA